ASPGVSVGTQRAHARSDVPTADYIGVRPVKGPGGTEFKAKGYIATTCVAITIAFMDSNGTVTALGYRSALSFRFKGNIPTGAAVGPGEVQVYRWIFDPHIRRCRPGGGLVAETPFKVTE